MANTQRELNEETEITLKLKVKINSASFLNELTEVDMKAHIEEAKRDLKTFLLQKISDEYFNEQLTNQAYYNYKVEDAEKIKT